MRMLRWPCPPPRIGIEAVELQGACDRKMRDDKISGCKLMLDFVVVWSDG
jgi:hypothetical protein